MNRLLIEFFKTLECMGFFPLIDFNDGQHKNAAGR
jgi:hypothetical protein